MKNLHSFFFIFFCFLLFVPSNSWAVKLKLRFDLIQLGGEKNTKGLDTIKRTGGGGLGLGILISYNQNMDIDTGYEYRSLYFIDSFEEYEGNYSSHFIQIGVSYTGIKITQTYEIITGVTFDIPVFGSAEVVQRSSGYKTTSNSLEGWGIYVNGGVTDREWDFYLYYRQRTLSYGLVPPGKSEKLKWTNSEYGLGLGYTF